VLEAKAFTRQLHYRSLFTMPRMGWHKMGVIAVPSMCLPDVTRSPKPFPSLFPYCKWSKTGWEQD